MSTKRTIAVLVHCRIRLNVGLNIVISATHPHNSFRSRLQSRSTRDRSSATDVLLSVCRSLAPKLGAKLCIGCRTLQIANCPIFRNCIIGRPARSREQPESLRKLLKTELLLTDFSTTTRRITLFELFSLRINYWRRRRVANVSIHCDC